ncbi:SDH family Clp fold serine proteinase [Leptospira kmetyi]|uniref:Peptidase n=1 Tax=Leptospira kmetyi TaxID=408139 RepID=A0ABX4N631_9LEPT|nr:peptidase [Leptospira kmetyi]PJZ28764.1 peptidase [Leptospira kmetyi]PJZ39530.1 peptidase [Leptospira kmetyi]
MGLMNEYIQKRLNAQELDKELSNLIKQYNAFTKSNLLVISTAINKPIPDIALGMDDYYIVYDLLKDLENNERLDVYLETPGGSGEAAEELVRLFRDKFKVVNFIISGEAKSAGTIMALSGDDIFMTDSGSLGPIDAQVNIGRMVISAHDYKEWIDEVRNNAIAVSDLNPFDATMVAQISPGELKGVLHALKFAEDLVIEWLPKYKFKNWLETHNSKKPVSLEMKISRAKEIAQELTNHGKWRSHGRSLKIKDLESIGLKIQRLDDTKNIADIVYRIQTVLRLFFQTTTVYKYFATDKNRILKKGVSVQSPLTGPASQEMIPNANPAEADFLNIDLECPNCKKILKFYVRFDPKIKVPEELKKSDYKPLPKEPFTNCACGAEIDLSGLKIQIETESGKKISENDR